MTTRLAIVATHPIQYHAPWFRGLAAWPGLETRVFFAQIPDPAAQGVGFDRPFAWDVPLLDGYSWESVPNARPRPLALEHRPADARQAEQVVDELGHALAGRPHAVKGAPAVVAERGGVVLEQHLAESVDGAQRTAQVVRDGVGERLELAVGGLELGGPLAHAPLEVRVEGHELRFRVEPVEVAPIGWLLVVYRRVAGVAGPPPTPTQYRPFSQAPRHSA